MSLYPHNLGFLRFAAEDCLTAYLTGRVQATVRPAFTNTETEHPLIVVYVREMQPRHETTHALVRDLMGEFRAISYAESETDSAGVELRAAREAHARLVSQVYEATMQTDSAILAALAAVQQPGISWSLFHVRGEVGGTQDGAYITTIQWEAIATPTEI